MVGAVLHGTAAAQVPTRDTTRTRRDSIAVAIPLPADSAAADSARARQRADSIRAARLARRAADSVKTPLATAELPIDSDVGGGYRWKRDEMFSTGALTLGELLGRVPESSDSHWDGSRRPRRTRIRAISDASGSSTTASSSIPWTCASGRCTTSAGIPLWTLEEVVAERAAEELRIHIRTWRVNKTTPVTRVDIATGDLATNTYRGFFGRRFSNGAALQVAAQQYNTTDERAGGDGRLFSALARLGWAKKNWSTDVTFLRTRSARTEQLRVDSLQLANLPPAEGVRTEGYARVAYRNVDSPYWLQLIAVTSRFAETNEKTPVTTTVVDAETLFVGDTVDTTATRTQYIVSAGTKLLGALISATGRLRLFNSLWFLTPSARIGYDRGMLSVTAYVEPQVSDSTFRADVSLRLTPLKFLALGGSLGRTSALEENDRPASLAYRGEVGVRLGRLWVTGGIMSVDTAVVPGPIVYDTLYQTVSVGPRRTTFATLRGPIWKAIGVNVVANKSPADQPYMPEYQDPE